MQQVARFLGVYYTWALGLVACSGAAVVVSFARAFSSSNKAASPGRFSTGSGSGPGSRSESPVGPGASPKWGQGGIGSSASSGGLVGSGSGGLTSGMHRASTPPSAGLDRAHPSSGGSHSPGLERGGPPPPLSRGHSKSPLHYLGGRDTGDPYGHGHATPPRGGGGLGLGQIHYERVGSNSSGFGDGVWSGGGGANSGDSQVSSSSNSGSGDGALLCRTSTLLVVCSVGLGLHAVYCFAAGGWGGSLGSAAATAAASRGDRWSTAAYTIVGWDASGGSGSSSNEALEGLNERDAAASADAVVYLALELLPAVAMVLALGVRGGSSNRNTAADGSSSGHHYHGAPGTVERRRAISSAMDTSRDFEKHRGGGGSGLMDRSYDGGNVLSGNILGGGTSSSGTSSGHNGGGSGRSGVDRSRDPRTALRSSGVNSGGSQHHHSQHPVSYGAMPLTHVTSSGDSSHHSLHRPHGGRSGHLAVGSTVASHERKRTDSDFAAPYSHAFDSSHGNNRSSSASNTSVNPTSSSNGSTVHSSGVHYPRPSGGSTFAFGRGSHLPSVAASPSVAPQPTPSPPPPIPVPTKPPQQFLHGDENGANRGFNEHHATSTVAPVTGNGNGYVDVPSTVDAEPRLVQFPTPVSVALAAPQPLHPNPRYSSDTPPVVAGNPPGAVEKSTTAEYFHPQPVSGQTRGF